MSHEAGTPGVKVSAEQLQMISCRYYTASKYVVGCRVLEVGCGAGLGLGYLAARAKNVIGGDRSEENVKCAHQHYRGRVGLLLLDAHALPFKDGCFDVAIAMEVIQYLHIEKFLDECHRVLKRGGTLLLCVPNQDAPGFQPSPLGRRYYSVPELLASLGRHHFDARIFGAFPIPRGATQQKLWVAMMVGGGKALDLLPGGPTAKEFLNRTFLGKNVVLGEELGDGDMAAEKFGLVPLSGENPDRRHRILYAVARAR